MDVLQTFKCHIENMIQNNNLNLKLSGVAACSDLQHLFYSASFIVDGPGRVPEPDNENLVVAQKIFQSCTVDDFNYSRLLNITALQMPCTELKRWQVNYLFRGE